MSVVEIQGITKRFERGDVVALQNIDLAIEPGELVSALIVPPAAHLRGTYTKFTTGSSEERPCVGIAALASMDESVCRELRLVIGAVSPNPLRMPQTQ